MDDKLSELTAEQLERRYRERAFAYFGTFLRNARVIPLIDIEADLEQHLTTAEMEDLSLIDILIRGRAKNHLDTPEVWLAIEVSSTVDRNDVERAERRAGLLRKLGYQAIPVVAGNKITEGGAALVEERNVLLVQNGRKQYVEEALTNALGV